MVTTAYFIPSLSLLYPYSILYSISLPLELSLKVRDSPHWSTWSPPPRIPIEEGYEVDKDDEFEPYVDKDVDQFTSDAVQVGATWGERRAMLGKEQLVF